MPQEDLGKRSGAEIKWNTSDADHVNLLGDNINTTKKNREILIVIT
jgi:hypothetical protein